MIPSGAPEVPLPNETPGAHARRLAEDKARHVASAHAGAAAAVVLGADTVVTALGRILGKPTDEAEAKAMLRFLSGKTHEVLTGVFLIRTDNGQSTGSVTTTRVRFRPLSDALIDWYLATGEPADKAGAYSIQDRGVLLSEQIEGSWSNVVGLPLEALPDMFARVSMNIFTHLPQQP